MDDKFNQIIECLTERASLKQLIYRNTIAIFERLRQITSTLATRIETEMKKIDPNVPVKFEEGTQFEFRLKVSGDLLICNMHTNAVTFPPDHLLFGNPFIMENPMRAFFGQILMYNFTADSMKYNRMNDEGYLLSRFLVNSENYFFIEGVGVSDLHYPDISKNIITDEVLLDFIQTNTVVAIETDLQATSFSELQVITMGDKEANSLPGAIQKVGFHLKSQEPEPKA